MYYPQSKIIANQQTNGQELVYKGTGIEYVGKYHMLANGKIYTGINPRDGQIAELTWSDEVTILDDFPDYDLVPQRILPKSTRYDAIRSRQNLKAPMSELIEPLYSAPYRHHFLVEHRFQQPIHYHLKSITYFQIQQLLYCLLHSKVTVHCL